MTTMNSGSKASRVLGLDVTEVSPSSHAGNRPFRFSGPTFKAKWTDGPQFGRRSSFRRSHKSTKSQSSINVKTNLQSPGAVKLASPTSVSPLALDDIVQFMDSSIYSTEDLNRPVSRIRTSLPDLTLNRVSMICGPPSPPPSPAPTLSLPETPYVGVLSSPGAFATTSGWHQHGPIMITGKGEAGSIPTLGGGGAFGWETVIGPDFDGDEDNIDRALDETIRYFSEMFPRSPKTGVGLGIIMMDDEEPNWHDAPVLDECFFRSVADEQLELELELENDEETPSLSRSSSQETCFYHDSTPRSASPDIESPPPLSTKRVPDPYRLSIDSVQELSVHKEGLSSKLYRMGITSYDVGTPTVLEERRRSHGILGGLLSKKGLFGSGAIAISSH